VNAVAPLKGAGFESLFVSRHEGKTRATMKIQEGCDRYCSYCIIPSVRGPVRSMPLDAVAAEAARLGSAGYREIVVTGIHLASYGRGTGDTLMDAIRVVHAAPGVRRVRLGSLEPVTVTEDFAREASELPGLMRQFHLSLQSGSPGVLKRMHRRYTPEEYRAAVDTLRRYMPDCAVTTDVIAGFPGETEEEFAETVAFVQAVALARIHVFPYSRRKGTVADAMPDQVDETLRRARAKKLIGVGNQLERRFVQGLVGTCQQVLFEQAAGEGLSEGYTGQYVRVQAVAKPGELCRVRIDGAEGTLAFGTVIEHEQEEDTDE
jgi:threonylcarbamoyladenosine tRNA methylthiotransferase MtaB